jgi:hypothetical protein
MADWLVSRPTVIVLAVVGALLSLTATFLYSRGWGSPGRLKVLNRTGYGFMWASIALFIYAGFRSGFQ